MSHSTASIAPPGTRLSPRQNLQPLERGLSVAAGSAIGVLAARRKGAVGMLLGITGALLVARGVSGASPVKRLLGERPDEADVARDAGWSGAALVSRAVTINAPRAGVFARFREFRRWPEWALNVKSVRIGDDGELHFETAAPAGTMKWQAAVTEARSDELLAFEAAPGSDVPVKARFEFRDAAGGRGTEIHGSIAYQPPGGSLGRYAAKLTQREPGIQLRRDLKRFKSLVETGEISVNDPQGSASAA